MDKGTMYQLKNLINRSLPSDPSDNVKAAEDFLLLLVHAHVLISSCSFAVLSNQYHFSLLFGKVGCSHIP